MGSAEKLVLLSGRIEINCDTYFFVKKKKKR